MLEIEYHIVINEVSKASIRLVLLTLNTITTTTNNKISLASDKCM